MSNTPLTGTRIEQKRIEHGFNVARMESPRSIQTSPVGFSSKPKLALSPRTSSMLQAMGITHNLLTQYMEWQSKVAPYNVKKAYADAVMQREADRPKSVLNIGMGYDEAYDEKKGETAGIQLIDTIEKSLPELLQKTATKDLPQAIDELYVNSRNALVPADANEHFIRGISGTLEKVQAELTQVTRKTVVAREKQGIKQDIRERAVQLMKGLRPNADLRNIMNTDRKDVLPLLQKWGMSERDYYTTWMDVIEDMSTDMMLGVSEIPIPEGESKEKVAMYMWELLTTPDKDGISMRQLLDEDGERYLDKRIMELGVSLKTQFDKATKKQDIDYAAIINEQIYNLQLTVKEHTPEEWQDVYDKLQRMQPKDEKSAKALVAAREDAWNKWESAVKKKKDASKAAFEEKSKAIKTNALVNLENASTQKGREAALQLVQWDSLTTEHKEELYLRYDALRDEDKEDRRYKDIERARTHARNTGDIEPLLSLIQDTDAYSAEAYKALNVALLEEFKLAEGGGTPVYLTNFEDEQKAMEAVYAGKAHLLDDIQSMKLSDGVRKLVMLEIKIYNKEQREAKEAVEVERTKEKKLQAEKMYKAFQEQADISRRLLSKKAKPLLVFGISDDVIDMEAIFSRLKEKKDRVKGANILYDVYNGFETDIRSPHLSTDPAINTLKPHSVALVLAAQTKWAAVIDNEVSIALASKGEEKKEALKKQYERYEPSKFKKVR